MKILAVISLLVIHVGLAQNEHYRLFVKKSEFLLYVFQGDSLVVSFPVAVGRNAGDKQRRGDYRTPEGEFVISGIHDSRTWVHDFGDGKGPVAGAYGPWFFRIETGADRTKSGKTWTGIGIHGTHDPTSIGTMSTEGCIRLANENLETLKQFIRRGAPVTISP